jgi:hypothetical protein
MPPVKHVPELSLSLNPSVDTSRKRSLTGHLARARPHLDRDGRDELRSAIERALSAGESRSPTHDIGLDLRLALRVTCARAQLQRVRAEQLLVDVKQIWMTISTARANRTDEALSSIITACIIEYYDVSDRSAD